MYKPPSVSENFATALDYLHDDMEAYYNFLDNFGTHYIKRMKLGAKYGYRSEFSNIDIQ